MIRKRYIYRGRQPKPPRCRGTSLIEVLVVITLVGMVLSSVVALFQFSSRNERKTRQSLQYSLTQQRLAKQFRLEAHQAVDAQLIPATEPSSGGISFQRSTGEIAQFVDGGDKIRYEVHRGSERLHHDTFAIPNDRRLSFDVSQDDRLAAIAMARTTDVHAESTGNGPLRIEALIGLNRRYTGASD